MRKPAISQEILKLGTLHWLKLIQVLKLQCSQCKSSKELKFIYEGFILADSTSKVSDKTTIEELNDTSEADDDDIDTGDTDDSTDEKDEDNVKLNNNTNDVMISRALQSPKSSDDRNGLASMEGLLGQLHINFSICNKLPFNSGNIQEMVRVAARNALQQSSSSDQSQQRCNKDYN